MQEKQGPEFMAAGNISRIFPRQWESCLIGKKKDICLKKSLFEHLLMSAFLECRQGEKMFHVKQWMKAPVKSEKMKNLNSPA